jgi:hypothetical protein
MELDHIRTHSSEAESREWRKEEAEAKKLEEKVEDSL